ncbi:MAG: tRNA (adenosine(37)-N6)-threonylcarbamoyltransferase complex transferase subunit TsaD [Saprospiraceae bacterium]|nr:tRNA (adenosine(37)-N6)-threonylcarbamoyltransferase complex transferase subunit TsaD [Saprospiraceae bacterium]
MLVNPVILAIESSCDETGAAVIVNGLIKSNVIATQQVHENFGGVVPELASRAHQQNIVPVVNQAFQESNISKVELDAVAFTEGPGLLGSLLVGVTFAKGLSMTLDIPLIGVHHMRAHILSHFIDDPKPSFPFICLTVSGGHTQIVIVKDYLDMDVIGETQDDAVGEAFDKAAKMLGLPYPGGPVVDQYAQKGNSQAFEFPDTDVPNLDFSFSGVKTAFLYFLREKVKANPNFIEENISDICASFQFKLIDMLMQKLQKASQETGIHEIAIAGGVSANSELRKRMKDLADINSWNLFIPKLEYCTDNAAMIAMAGHFKYLKGQFSDLSVSAHPRLIF